MRNVVAKDLRSSDGKYKMRVEQSQMHFKRDNVKANNEIAALLDDVNNLSQHEIDVLRVI